MQFRLSIITKVLFVCSGICLFTWLIGSFLLYQGASRALRQEVREHVKAIAVTAALQINPRDHETIRTRVDEHKSAYQRLKQTLVRVRNANHGIRYVYTLRKSDRPNTLQFVVDAESDPKNISHVGDLFSDKSYPELQKAFHGPNVDKEATADKWGTWLSGYAPILDSSGRAVAIVGVDLSVDQLAREESLLRSVAVRNVCITLMVAALLSLLFTRSLIKRLHIFKHATHRVKHGDLDFQLQMHHDDEFGDFAKSFNRMIDGLKDSRERILEQATQDYLTGLYNHMHFHERLSIELERAERYGSSLCLLMLDVDRFKSINDTLGHPIGDSLLWQLASVLKENLRSIDIAARYGGDEFTVILPEQSEADGLVAAERLRNAVEKTVFYARSLRDLIDDPCTGEEIHITATIGLASYPTHQLRRDGLIMAADIALCRAKHVARNSVCSYGICRDLDATLDPEKLYKMLRDPDVASVQSLAAAVDAKDRCTAGHSERVTTYALRLAKAMRLSREEIDVVKIAGLLHDLGKIGVPESVLNKPGGLTQDEREVINRHPVTGGNILKNTPQLEMIIPAVVFHHERWDGAGYPDGLCGKQIPLMARILAVADAFDAMTSDRPYRKALSVQAALVELRSNAGAQFDPDMVDAFISCVSATEWRNVA